MGVDEAAGLAKVLLVNTADRGGGAEAICIAALEGFERLGTEAWLAVGDKRTDHPRVMALALSNHLDYRPYGRRGRQAILELRRRVDSRLGREDFNHPYSHRLLELTGSRPDLVICRNLHGGYFDLRALVGLTRDVPVVLWLADSWLFTGHCACPLGCDRWETGCGSCPDLSIPPAVERDATAHNWRRKRSILRGARLSVVSPSRWLLDRAERSLLGDSILESTVLPHGVDLTTFSPGDGVRARRSLGIDREAHVLLFAANGGAANPYKDFATVREAFERLARAHGGHSLELLVVGGNETAHEQVGSRGRIQHLLYRDDPVAMSELYRCADLYVHAAPEEVFCLAAAEALACGTPVAAAASGGITEVVEHDRTGLLTPPGGSKTLAEAVAALLHDAPRRAAMASAAHESAVKSFDVKRTVEALHAWCAGIPARRAANEGRTPAFR